MLWLSDPDSRGQICFWKSWCLKSQQAPWLDRLFSLSMSSPGRVDVCVSIRTFIVDVREADGGRTRWQVIWLSGLFPGALVWSRIIPAPLLFWPVCVTIATARESLFRLPSAGNPLRVGQCRRSHLHLIFTPNRAGTWTEIVLRVWAETWTELLQRGHDLGEESKWTRGGNSLRLSRRRPCCCKPALNRLN